MTDRLSKNTDSFGAPVSSILQTIGQNTTLSLASQKHERNEFLICKKDLEELKTRMENKESTREITYSLV